MLAPLPPALLRDYTSLTEEVALADVRGRTRIRLTGADRATFLHGFCTNDIKRLRSGDGCEAFVTNAKGKVEGHVFVFCLPDALVLDGVPDQAEHLLAHLNRYVIREDVQLEDLAAQFDCLLVGGPRAAELLESRLAMALPETMYGTTSGALAGIAVTVSRVPLLAVPAYLLSCTANQGDALRQSLTSSNAPVIDPQVLEVARVEAGFPAYGCDITADNLPQEVDRTEQAVSFNKGCYLGQETVARLDSLGHVNRSLAALKWERLGGSADECGLIVDGQTIGRWTSLVWSPRFQSPLSLAYLRRGSNRSGLRLETTIGVAQVVDLSRPQD